MQDVRSWVICGHHAMQLPCPLYPRKRTCAVQLGMSLWANSGHAAYSITSSAWWARVELVRRPMSAGCDIANCETKSHDALAALREGLMITIPELASEALGSHLATHMGRRFGSTDEGLIEIVQSVARLALDCIGNSDALYHNVEHTMLVTLAGYDILTGRRLLKETNASDYAHVLVACLYHDIGYVRGILNGDSADEYIIDAKGNKATVPRGSSDAALLDR